jgi:acetyltransferase-like isoleucine patch superfamily enzyme
MMTKIEDFILFVLSIPFRIKCKKIGRAVRIAFGYSIFGCNLKNVIIEDKVNIGSNAWIQTVPSERFPEPSITIGANTNIGRQVTISAAKKISIGKNTLISYGVSIIDHNHAFEDVNISPLFQGIDSGSDILIEEDCFIGAGSFILKGVTLGRHCIVGSNSVVTSSFADFSVIAGVPAKLIRNLKENK